MGLLKNTGANAHNAALKLIFETLKRLKVTVDVIELIELTLIMALDAKTSYDQICPCTFI